MLLNIIRFFRGSVELSINDSYPERFINLCAKSKIPLWNVRRNGKTFTAHTTLKASQTVPSVAAKAGVICKITKKTGVPYYTLKYRKRTGIFAGIVLVLALPAILSQFVWNIQIKGNELLTADEIKLTLADLGVRRGVYGRSVDARDVERRLIVANDELSWVAVNIRGSTAEIEVRERTVAPNKIDKTTPHNVVAGKSGFIIEMDVYEGQPIVKRGDSVVEGDILVSGIMEDKVQKSRTVHARASIQAQIEDSIAVTIPYKHMVHTYRGFQIKKTLLLWGKKVPVSGSIPKEPYKLESAVKGIPFVSNFLPIYLQTDKYILTEEYEETLSIEDAKGEAMRELEFREQIGFPKNTVLSRELTGQETEKSFILFADYIRICEIAEERPILTNAALPENT